MTKKEVQKRVLQGGEPLALSKFTWDEMTKTFSTRECNLIIDFKDIDSCTFITKGDCTLTTRHSCTFKTWGCCTFDTGSWCIFNTASDCTFKAGPGCTFKTGPHCTFSTESNCTFYTGLDCTWVSNSKRYPFSPLFIGGTAWPVNVYKPGYLKIGCEEHTFAKWSRNARELARLHISSPEAQEEYLGLIRVARAWAKEKGWLNVK